MLAVNALECTRGERVLFSELNFQLAPYTLLAVRGVNGSGKTSLLRVLCGLLSPTAGMVTWNGTDIRRCRDEYYGQLAYVGHLNGVKEELSGRENLQFWARTSGLVADDAAADAALCQLGLDGFQHLPCKALSQGQRRRVALARLYLSASRPLWILDEPFAALDVSALALTQLLLDTHLANGGMVVLTTHQEMSISARLISQVVLGS